MRLNSILAALLALLALMFAAITADAADHSPRVANGINFAGSEPVIDLKKALSPYHAASGVESDASQWYMMTATNEATVPATRILIADQPVDASLRVFPLRAHAAIRQIASSDADVIVVNAHAYGRYAFRVTVPPASSVSLAIRLSDADPQPAVTAWTEAAIAAHNRQLAVFFSAAAGLIAAAFVIAAGLAAITGHAADRWAAATLGGIFLMRLASAGLFDAMGVTVVGGPYGMFAMLAGATLAAGVRLTDTIVPFETYSLRNGRWRDGILVLLLLLSVLSLLGVPGTMLVTGIVVVTGTTLLTAYLVYSGQKGAQAARVAAPSAAVFALVAAGAAAVALGWFSNDTAAPNVIGGFAAAGAVLLALAIAADESLGLFPVTGSRARAVPVQMPVLSQTAATDPLPDSTLAALQAIGASYQGVFDLDLVREIVTLSPEASALLGIAGGTQVFPAVEWIARVHPDDRDVYTKAVADFRMQPGLAFRIEFRVRNDDGQYVWFELRATMLGDGAGADRCLGLVADVTTRKESDGNPTRDMLTGLGNRLALTEELERQGGNLQMTTLAVLDIDRFKSIHASLGDAGGDYVLKTLAQRLHAACGGVAEVFRLGGDGFALLFLRSDTNAATIGAELVETCSRAFSWKGRSVFAPASVGVALGAEARHPLDLIRNAEMGLLEAKRQGGACACLYRRDLKSVPPRTDAVGLEEELRKALAEGQFVVLYQPIMRLDDGSLAGFEALLRWNHPKRGMLPPAEFLMHAEETGLIVAMGRFALERTGTDLAQWQRFFPIEPPLFASVNLSRRQLQDRNLETFFGGLVGPDGARAGTLKLELTGNSIAAAADMGGLLMRLREAGAGLSIDDFGTGLSSLGQLQLVPFDIVKIDRSFLVGNDSAGATPNGNAISRAVVDLAHEFGSAVVFKGVEAESDAVWVREIGCEFAQGFYYSPPLARAEALKFIARHHKDRSDRSSAVPVSGSAGVSRQS
jgi:diguanylate cyclase (GGDEF)-like protein